MEARSPRKSPERVRVDAAMERWRDAGTTIRLWSELTDGDKERLAVRHLRSLAARLGWDEVLCRLGVRPRTPS